MEKETISFRLETEKKDALDKIAEALDRDRTYIINEAISAYLDLQKWQTLHIKEGLRRAKAGEIASEEEVEAVFKRLTT
jgi:predicted transcriptional regulator